MFRKIFSLLCIVFLLTACDYKEESYGDFDEIVVFADSSLLEAVRPELQRTFDQFIYTPIAERSFEMEWQPFEKLNSFRLRRNILFLGLVDGEDAVSQYISKALSPELKDAIIQGRIFQVFQKDFFAAEQMCIILTASDIETLRRNLEASGDEIHAQLESYNYERMARIMFLRGEQTLLEDYFETNLGWRIKVQHDYYVAREEKDGNFLWLRRAKPDRNLFVYRFPANGLPAGEDWLIHKRDSLAAVHFESDSVDLEDTYIRRTVFAERQALKMIGVWQNYKHKIGGPFRTYAFFDEQSGYVYMIDYMVTAPDERKKPYLDQLEVIARSFELKQKNTGG